MIDTVLVQGDRVTSVWRETSAGRVRPYQPTETLLEVRSGSVHVGMIWRDGLFHHPPTPDISRALASAPVERAPISAPAAQPAQPLSQTVNIQLPTGAAGLPVATSSPMLPHPLPASGPSPILLAASAAQPAPLPRRATRQSNDFSACTCADGGADMLSTEINFHLAGLQGRAYGMPATRCRRRLFRRAHARWDFAASRCDGTSLGSDHNDAGERPEARRGQECGQDRNDRPQRSFGMEVWDASRPGEGLRRWMRSCR